MTHTTAQHHRGRMNGHQTASPTYRARARAHETTKKAISDPSVLLLAFVVLSDYVHRLLGAHARVPRAPCP